MWETKEFEICESPEDNDEVQFAALHVLQLRRLGIPTSEVKFFMRLPEKEEEK